jgi:hypothetical protein
MRPATLFRSMLALLAVTGCNLSEQLAGEPCAVAEDCWRTQECARTAEEAALELPGMCLPEGTGCVRGQQLGCACDPMDYEADCGIAAAKIEVEYPNMICDPDRRICVLEQDEEGQP